MPATGLDRVGAHRRTERRPEQVHDEKVAAGRFAVLEPFELVGVERTNDERIERHHALASRFRPRPVDVVSPFDV
jgi:hypothetical protein